MLSSSVAASDESAAVGARYNSTFHSNDFVQSTICKNHDTVLGSSPKLASKFNSLLNHHHHVSPTGISQKQSQISHIRGQAQLSPSSLAHRDHHQPGIGRVRCTGGGSPVGNSHHRVCKTESQHHSIGGSGDSGGNGGGASGVDRRMNTNGFDRSGMTGNNNTTSESISPWQPEVAVPCQSTSRASGPSVLTSVAGSHEPSSIPTGGTFYGPTQSGSAFSRRNLYTTTGSSLLPFSPSIYGPQQTPQLSLTSPYYYPGGYPFLSGHPFVGPYPSSYQDSPSAAEMLQRIRHVSPSQIPPYLPQMSPYRIPPTTSPGPSNIQRPLIMDPSLRHDSKSPKSEPGMLTDIRASPSKDALGPSSSSGRSRSPHHHPPTGLHPHLSPHPRKSAHQESGIRDAGYTVPAPQHGGKEDPRRFIRPPEFKLPKEEPLHKRHKSEGRSYYTSSIPSHYHHQRHSTSIPSSTVGLGNQGAPHLPPHTGYHQSPGSYPTQPHYPPHFMKGSVIQLANGEFKRVEDLKTEDFVTSADISSDLKIDSSTVVKREESRERGTALLGFSVGEHRIQVTVEATLEHPFFVFGQGWSSCDPDRTFSRFGLRCQRLCVGDVCISLTHKDTNSHAAEIIARQQSESGRDTKKPISQISKTSSTLREPGERGGTDERERPPRSAPSSHRTADDRGGAGGKSGRLESVPELRSTDTSSSQSHRSGSPTATSSTTLAEETSQDSESRPPQSSTLSRKRRWSAPDQFSSEEGTIDVVGGTSPQPSPTPTDLRTETSSSPGHEGPGQGSSGQVKEEKDDSSD